MGLYFASASTYLLVNHQYVFENGLFHLSGGTSWLFTTSIWQVIERVHIVYSSWFFWRYDSLLSFGIGGPKFFRRVAATMILKSFVKLSMIVYFWILKKIWSKDDSYIILVYHLPILWKGLEERDGEIKNS